MEKNMMKTISIDEETHGKIADKCKELSEKANRYVTQGECLAAIVAKSEATDKWCFSSVANLATDYFNVVFKSEIDQIESDLYTREAIDKSCSFEVIKIDFAPPSVTFWVRYESLVHSETMCFETNLSLTEIKCYIATN
jgi:hypothetical protein